MLVFDIIRKDYEDILQNENIKLSPDIINTGLKFWDFFMKLRRDETKSTKFLIHE